MSLPQIDVAYAAGLFDELYRQTEDVPGVTRAAWNVTTLAVPSPHATTSPLVSLVNRCSIK